MASFAVKDLFKKFRIPKWLVRWSMAALLIGLVGSVAAAGILYQVYRPHLKELRGKDSEKYQAMVKAVFELEVGAAWTLYQELERMTPAQVYALKYEKWKASWEQDSKFREAALQERDAVHEQERLARNEGYAHRMNGLTVLRGSSPAARRAVWGQATPWQKNLILRDACTRSLARQVREETHSLNRRRHQEREAFGVGARALAPLPAEDCARWVMPGYSPASVDRSLLRLKKGMNYFYFVRMVEAVGLPREGLFTLQGRLARMTDSYEEF